MILRNLTTTDRLHKSRQSMTHQHRTQQRRAVTLIEVLMSTMVISLGIMGLLALIPLGNHLANRGLEADRVSSLGQRIYREARTRGALNPDNWIDPYNNSPVIGNKKRGTIRTPGEFLPARQAYLIDPTYFIPKSVIDDVDNVRNEFPSQDLVTNAPAGISTNQMRRLSLSTLPKGNSYMSLAQANLAFASSDQLAFERPKSTDDPLTYTPRQQFYKDDSGNNLKRQIQRPFSWMIMLSPAPIFDLNANLPFNVTAVNNNVPASTDQFNMSTIIMRNRNMIDGFTDIGEYKNLDRGEHVFEVKPGSYSFGEVTLRIPAAGLQLEENDATDANDIMDLARGKWICLNRNFRRPNNNPVTIHSVYQWYRVQSVDEVALSDDGAYFEINVSIQGPDWGHYTVNNAGKEVLHPPTQAIYVRSVVGVYERKVRLESSSKWTP